MKKMKRVLAFILAFCMVINMNTVNIFAETTETGTWVSIEVSTYTNADYAKPNGDAVSGESSTAKVGVSFGTSHPEWFSETQPDPYRTDGSGAEFEGWLEYKIIELEDGSWDYQLVSDTLYSTQEIIDKVIPNYDVAYVAKWSDIDIEDYFYDGPTVSVDLRGNDGYFDITVSGCAKESTDYLNVSAIPNRPLGSRIRSLADPVFWDSTREFLGWKERIYDTDWELLEESEELITTEALLSRVPVEDRYYEYEAQWAGDDSDYYSDLEFNAYGGTFEIQSWYWNDDVKEYDNPEETGNWMVSGREGQSVSELLDQFQCAIYSDPVKEGASFEGWLEFSWEPCEDEDGNYYEEYTLINATPISTAAILQKTIPDDSVVYAAKWSDIPAENYFYNGPTVYVEFEGDGGTFDANGTSGEYIDSTYYGVDCIPNATVSTVVHSLTDPSYWNPDREFLGWMLCVSQLVTDEEGDTYYEYVQMPDTELFTTEEVLAYVVTESQVSTPLMFVAQWNKEESEFMTNVEISGYNEVFTFQDFYINEEDQKVYGDSWITSSHSGDVRKQEGTTVQDVMNDWSVELMSDPVKEGATFEGWIEFSVTYEENEDGDTIRIATPVSEKACSTAELLTKTIPENDVIYAAKWSDILLEDYFWVGEENWLSIDGDGGYFTYTDKDGTAEAELYFGSVKSDCALSKSVYDLTDPTFWNSERKFLGWKIYVLRWQMAEDGSFYGEYELVSNKTFTTAEVLAYEMPDTDVEIRASWDSDYYDYYSTVYMDGYGGEFQVEYVYETGGEVITDVFTNSFWGNNLKENNQSIQTQMKDDLGQTILSDPVKEEAVFQGWMEYEIVTTVVNEQGHTKEEYVRKSDTLYSTEEILSNMVPEYDVRYVAKWSDKEFEDYFKPAYMVLMSTDYGEFTVKYDSDGEAEEYIYGPAYEEVIPEGDTIHETWTEYDYSITSISAQCAQLKSWTLYSYEELEWEYLDAEDIPVNDAEHMYLLYDEYTDEDGSYKDYMVAVGYKEIGTVSATELYDLVINHNMVAVANWEDKHTPAPAVSENIVEATTEQEGSYDKVIYCSECEEELSREKVTIKKLSISVEVPESEETMRVEVETAVTTVPETIADQYTSVGTIEDALVEKAVADDSIVKDDNSEAIDVQIEVMDVELQVQKADGTWEKVDTENFPSEGVTVVLPYPAGTGADTHNFVITHMITTGDDAGTIEVLAYETVADGLKVTVTSLSPIGIAYQPVHIHTWNAGTVKTPAGCTEDGVKILACTGRDCKETKEVPIEATGHTWETTYTLDKESTCAIAGSESLHCSVCDSSQPGSSRAIALAEHKWASGYTVDKEPTYTSAGEMSIHCVKCDAQKAGSSVTMAKLQSPFTDVKEGAWYYHSVMYAYENGLFAGTSDTTFEPNSPLTRSMLVMVLYRMEGRPKVSADAPIFPDVNSTKYYAKAISWAAQENLVSGYKDGTFGPEDSITREQIAKILYRYAEYKGYDVTASKSLDEYQDASQVASYAVKYMKWATAEGLIEGSKGVLNPKGDATRAQISAILRRFIEKYE